MVEKSKLDEDKERKAVDPSHYRGMIGTLLYLTANRPNLQFVGSSITLTTFADADHAGCQDTRRSTSGSMQLMGDRLGSSITLTTFADADHAGCQDTRRSTSGSMQLMGDRLRKNLISCKQAGNAEFYAGDSETIDKCS
nr:hypothetical protein [Tanacetum cinerariifolium]